MWTLIPGFVGVGQIVAAALGRSRHEARSGLNLILVSAVMFVIFAAIFGKLAMFGPYFPAVVLILVGVALDTVAQIETFLLTRNYEGFMKHTRLKGRAAYS